MACCSGGDGHGVWPSVPQRLKPPQGGAIMARLKPCPFEVVVVGLRVGVARVVLFHSSAKAAYGWGARTLVLNVEQVPSF